MEGEWNGVRLVCGKREGGRREGKREGGGLSLGDVWEGGKEVERDGERAKRTEEKV